MFLWGKHTLYNQGNFVIKLPWLNFYSLNLYQVFNLKDSNTNLVEFKTGIIPAKAGISTLTSNDY